MKYDIVPKDEIETINSRAFSKEEGERLSALLNNLFKTRFPDWHQCVLSSHPARDELKLRLKNILTTNQESELRDIIGSGQYRTMHVYSENDGLRKRETGYFWIFTTSDKRIRRDVPLHLKIMIIICLAGLVASVIWSYVHHNQFVMH